jgi:hypothetical protein
MPLRAYKPQFVLLVIAATLSQKHAFGGGVATPKLVLDETRRDLGIVFAGERVTHTFTVRNEGTSPLQLSEKTSARWQRSKGFGSEENYERAFLPSPARAAPS